MISLNQLLDRWGCLSYAHTSMLNEASDQVHRAAQFISMTGKCLLPQQADDSQTNMTWDHKRKMLRGKWIPSPTPFYLGLVPASLTLKAYGEEDQLLAELSVNGRTKKEVKAWWIEQLKQFGCDQETFDLNLHYDIPPHPTDRGTPFQLLDDKAFAEFSLLRELGHEIISQIEDKFDDASPTATWPHHFDVGSYLVPARGEDRSMLKTIAVGMAIHDEHMNGHYFYVNPWRKDGKLVTDSLSTVEGGGRWITGKWVGAILPLEELSQESSIETQATRAVDFFHDAVDTSLNLLEENAPKWNTGR